ncbi:MAG: phosphatase PAP2 family protein [Acidobacteriota bacterium]|nr:phosphatase PAP2 family protein [Acidobacteriota bacterium]
MNPIDASILHFFNRFAQHSELMDKLIFLVTFNVLIQGGLIIAWLWWAWFRNAGTITGQRERELVLSGAVLSIAALAAARVLALSLPFRVRPRYTPALHFRLPTGSADLEMIHWSAFPSDHAVLFFSLATTLFFISRKAGILLYCYVFFIVCLPRIYLGVHFPTDIVAGALLGVGIASLSLIKRLREFIAHPLLRWHDQSPGLFYPFFFLSTLLLSTEFESVRTIAVAGWNVMRKSAPFR